MRHIFTLGHTATWLLAGCLLFTGCSDNDEKTSDRKNQKTSEEIYHANIFAKEVLGTYYYWNEDIAASLKKLDPKNNTDPIKTVNDIRYHEGVKEIDKWTSLIDNMNEFESGVSGVTKTYGYQPITYRLDNKSKQCISAVAYVSANSPASKAGLKRGDIIYRINGEDLTTSNFREQFNSERITLSLAKIEKKDDTNVIVPINKDVTLSAIEMYEDPILKDTIFDIKGKKVGYLAYASFDLNSIPKLIEVSEKFKAEGVKELILDFRYNGGGYVVTENIMASMYAPEDVVRQHKVFEKEKYNKILTKEFDRLGQQLETHFKQEFTFKDGGKVYNYNTTNANIGIERVYGIITRNTASASEALLSGLMPYVDVKLFGEQSHGKYCTGWMISAEDYYQKDLPRSIKNWGMYVMVAIYQNVLGQTPCMPDGLKTDYYAFDDPLKQEQFGDVNESMLKDVLRYAGMEYPETKSSRSVTDFNLKTVEGPRKGNFGKYILLPEQLPDLK